MADSGNALVDLANRAHDREDVNMKAIRDKEQQNLTFKIAPLRQQLAADQERLKTLVDSVGQPKLDANGKHADYDMIESRMAKTIGDIRQAAGDKVPSDHPGRMAETVNGIRQWLKMGGKNKQQLDTAQSTKVNDWRNQNTQMAGEFAVGALPYAMTPEGMKAAEAYRLQVLKNEGAAQRGGSARPVPYYPGAVNLKTASSMLDQGIQFNGEDGNPLDVSKIPEGSVLIPVYLGGGKSYWTVGTDKGRYETAGNQRLLEPAVGGPNPEAPSLGPVRVPSSTTRTQTAPGGGQVLTGTSTVIPQNSGIPSTTPHGTTPRSEPTLHARPQGNITRGLQGKADVGRGKSILPNIQNMTPQNAAAARKSQPAVSALLGLYGDPQSPQAPSMVEFAHLANNQHAQQVLGEAFKLLDQSMGEISDPGIIQTLGTAAGWANFRAQAEAGAQQATGTQMTPQEREYFDTAIASMADIIGSRSATGQSPARFSVKSIQNELPLIGLSGTPDAESYLTKMQTIGRQVRVGLNAMPDNSRALAWLDKREADIAKQKSGGGKGQQKLKVGDPIVQGGHKFKITAIDKNGRVTAAEPM
jgi:hypothetical protein